MTLPFDETDRNSPADTLASPSTPGAFECEAVSLRLTLGRMGQRLGWRTFLNSVKEVSEREDERQDEVALLVKSKQHVSGILCKQDRLHKSPGEICELADSDWTALV